MEGIFGITEAAKELGCSTRWLRDAEKKGKLPKAKRDINNWRVYTGKDLNRLRKLLVPGIESNNSPG